MEGYLRAEISVSALRHNLDLLRSRMGSGVKLCAVVKANAYGHGVKQILAGLDHQADMLGVASCSEAAALRDMGWQGPLMQFALSGAMDAGSLAELIAGDITLTLTDRDELLLLKEAARRAGRPAKAHIKIDTGMTRSGVLPEDLPGLFLAAADSDFVKITGMYTHFACSEDPDKRGTFEQFSRLSAALDKCGRPEVCLHAANSAAVIDLPQTHLTMVRPGLAMYGIQPGRKLACKLPLRPVLRLVAPVVMVKEVPAGAATGYGWTYRFDKPARVALVPIGYADGYFRALSNVASMRVGGVDCPVRGRVSMDQTIIDVTAANGVKVGDQVEIISNDPAAPHSLENLAALANTIPYEIVSRLGDRISRVTVE